MNARFKLLSLQVGLPRPVGVAGAPYLNAVMHRRKEDWAAAAELAACPALPASWQASLARRAASRVVVSSAPRLRGNG